MLKKIVSLLVSFTLVMSYLIPSYAIEDYVPESYNYTLGEVKDILNCYFLENNIFIKEGTDEYYIYLLDQLMYKKDKVLLLHPKYEIILDYASEYIVLYQNDEYENSIVRNKENCKFSLNDSKVDLSKHFNKTIGEVSADLQSYEQIQAKKYSNNTVFSYSTLDVSKEIAYARQYATTYNPNYKNYDSDCTNFASQCLVAGGLKMVKNSSIPEYLVLETTTQWYHEKIYGTYFVSTSFIRVADFYSYWQYKSGAVSHSSKTDCAQKMKAGDMVILGRPSTKVKYHTIVITKGGTSGTFCAHTNNRKDEAFSNIDSSNYFNRLTFANGE